MVIDIPMWARWRTPACSCRSTGRGGRRNWPRWRSSRWGLSHPSYQFSGRQWGAGHRCGDARGGLSARPVGGRARTWDGGDGAGAAGAAWPSRSFRFNALDDGHGHGAKHGRGCGRRGGVPSTARRGRWCWRGWGRFLALMDKRCLTLDPIGIYEWMGRTAGCAGPMRPSATATIELQPRGLLPLSPDLRRCAGAGAGRSLGHRDRPARGIAVSAASSHVDVALDYAFWIAGGRVPGGALFRRGPASRAMPWGPGPPGPPWESERLQRCSPRLLPGHPGDAGKRLAEAAPRRLHGLSGPGRGDRPRLPERRGDRRRDARRAWGGRAPPPPGGGPPRRSLR